MTVVDRTLGACSWVIIQENPLKYFREPETLTVLTLKSRDRTMRLDSSVGYRAVIKRVKA